MPSNFDVIPPPKGRGLPRMKIDDYKKLFEIKYEGGWSDDTVIYAKCKTCGVLPIFDKYLIKNWYLLNGNQRKKRFYAAIMHHINTYHPGLILPKRIKMLEQDMADIVLNKALHFLKNFPFRPYIKEERLDRVPLKVWKPGIIVLPHSIKEKKE
jgi:hypothetical protein